MPPACAGRSPRRDGRGCCGRFAVTHPADHPPLPPRPGHRAPGWRRWPGRPRRRGSPASGSPTIPHPRSAGSTPAATSALDPFVALGYAAAHTTGCGWSPTSWCCRTATRSWWPRRAPRRAVRRRFTLAVGAGYLRGEFAGARGGPRGAQRPVRRGPRHAGRHLDGRRRVGRGPALQRPGHHRPPRPGGRAAPPIWIGGNGGQARQRVADQGQGWCPFPAPPQLARTARTRRPGHPRGAGRGHRRPARPRRRRRPRPGRSTSPSATPPAATPPTDAFDAAAHLAGLAQLAALGVTWVQVGCPATPWPAVETVERYGEAVIPTPPDPGRRPRPGSGPARDRTATAARPARTAGRCGSRPRWPGPGRRSRTSRGRPGVAEELGGSTASGFVPAAEAGDRRPASGPPARPPGPRNQARSISAGPTVAMSQSRTARGAALGVEHDVAQADVAPQQAARRLLGRAVLGAPGRGRRPAPPAACRRWPSRGSGPPDQLLAQPARRPRPSPSPGGWRQRSRNERHTSPGRRRPGSPSARGRPR